jgi:hypothetical protein
VFYDTPVKQASSAQTTQNFLITESLHELNSLSGDDVATILANRKQLINIAYGLHSLCMFGCVFC